MNEVDQVIIRRLKPLVTDPFLMCCDMTFAAFKRIASHFESWSTFVSDNDEGIRSTQEYNVGRILFFVEQLNADHNLDAISVDNVCIGGHVLAEPIIIDGWHRFAAHVIVKKKYINVSYSGRVDLLEYLTGQRRRKP